MGIRSRLLHICVSTKTLSADTYIFFTATDWGHSNKLTNEQYEMLPVVVKYKVIHK